MYVQGRIRNFAILGILLLCFELTAFAQVDHRITVNGSAGFTTLTGQISNRLDNGWGVTGGIGYLFTRDFEADVQVGYNGFGVTNSFLRQVGEPGGDAHVWSFTVDPKIRLTPGRQVDPYLIGGVGYYRRTITFTAPTAIPVVFFDPFFGFISGLAPGDVVLSDITQDGVGGSFGAGFEVKLGDSAAKFFTEVRYHYADTGNIATRMIPVSFGFRW